MLLWNSAWSRHTENAPRKPGPDGQTPPDNAAPYVVSGEPLGESRRILACHSPDVQGEGFEWEGERSDVFVSKPDGREALHPLVFAARAKIAVAVQGGAAGEFRVFALGTDGARRFEVPCVFRNGRIGFEMNAGGADGKAVILYEIERRNQLLSEIER